MSGMLKLGIFQCTCSHIPQISSFKLFQTATQILRAAAERARSLGHLFGFHEKRRKAPQRRRGTPKSPESTHFGNQTMYFCVGILSGFPCFRVHFRGGWWILDGLCELFVLGGVRFRGIWWNLKFGTPLEKKTVRVPEVSIASLIVEAAFIFSHIKPTHHIPKTLTSLQPALLRSAYTALMATKAKSEALNFPKRNGLEPTGGWSVTSELDEFTVKVWMIPIWSWRSICCLCRFRVPFLGGSKFFVSFCWWSFIPCEVRCLASPVEMDMFLVGYGMLGREFHVYWMTNMTNVNFISSQDVLMSYAAKKSVCFRFKWMTWVSSMSAWFCFWEKHWTLILFRWASSEMNPPTLAMENPTLFNG